MNKPEAPEAVGFLASRGPWRKICLMTVIVIRFLRDVPCIFESDSDSDLSYEPRQKLTDVFWKGRVVFGPFRFLRVGLGDVIGQPLSMLYIIVYVFFLAPFVT